MGAEKSYWNRRSVSRRTALQGAAVIGGGAVALGVVGCGGSNDSGGGGGAKTGNKTDAIDWTKGTPGGTMHVQTNMFPGALDIVGSAGGVSRLAGMTHSSLLQYKAGKSGIDGTSLEIDTDTAQALPEQTDQTTYTFKLRPGVKFHNGRAVTAEDVRYSFDRYTSEKSLYRDDFAWIDKTSAPDAQTFVVKAKTPYVDGVESMTLLQYPYILCKEHEESPAVNEKLLGSGPFLWNGAQQGVTVMFKKNPDYFDKPYPYFDAAEFNVITDTPRQVADFVSKQVQFAWFASPEYAGPIKQGRPDAVNFQYPAPGQQLWMKTDKGPYADKRVRQGISKSVNRQRIRDGVFLGVGEDDQTMSLQNAYWKFKKPKELKSATNWVYDPAEAKKLFAAAGLTLPFDDQLSHVGGPANQFQVDAVTLIEANWKELGIASIKDQVVENSRFGTTARKGQYDGFGYWHNQQYPVLGSYWRARFWSPPAGVQFPTDNIGFVNNPGLSGLFDKQMTQFNHAERRATFGDIEEILGEEQYKVIMTTYTHDWFVDPMVKNAGVFQWSFISTANYVRYWWFGS